MQGWALRGGCLCGENRFEINVGHLYEIQHCHCSQCRKLGGAPFVSWTPIPEQDFRWTASSQLIRVRSSSEASRLTCSRCATTLQMVYAWQDGTVWPAVGAIDDASLPPTLAEIESSMRRVVHICVKSKAAWLELGALLSGDCERLDHAFE